ncbi:hypothetical protein FE784_07020 [Paenibacillus hemerocallicola]|uniref:Peptidase S74 domain-containing protein n=1 Tax=Paenibacillus hemerocallicola TaxID=1172614 RepID=A0A5C4TEI7_9BACL|nr:tail fiber domain-containing protein [Paenibacillus hemerocallicola]TNJ66947.1 hypothetical protein FE784_07020 [Paenibacillus hemerocallicola]
MDTNKETGNGPIERTDEESGAKISRRSLLTSIGMAGVAVVSGGLIHESLAGGLNGATTVTGEVYKLKRITGCEEPILDADCVAFRRSGESPERTVGEALRDTVSLKDFGAQCDGIADDTAAYAAMRGHLGSGPFIVPSDSLIGGRILPAGAYSLTRSDFADIGTDNKVANPTFASSAAGWTLGGFAAAAGPDRITHLVAGASSAKTTVFAERRTVYLLRVKLITAADGVINFRLGNKDLYGPEKLYQENGVTVAGAYMSAAVMPNGTGAEQLRPISASVWSYAWLTNNTVDGANQSGNVTLEISTGTHSTWRGEILSVELIKIAKPLVSGLGLVGHDDSTLLDQWGVKISNGNYGTVGLGDHQTLQLINGDGKTTSEGAHNVAIGARTLASTIDGDENTAVGDMAMQFCEGSGNTAIGYSAQKFGQKGMENTSIGYKTLTTNVCGIANTIGGFRSAAFNITGSYNSAWGWKSLERNKDGSYNVAIGYMAGFNIGSVGNVAIGSMSGPHIGGGGPYSYTGSTSVGHEAKAYGSYSVALGAQAQVGSYNPATNVTTAYSNSAAIGYQAAVSGSNQVQLGNSGTTTYVYGTVQNRSDERDKADIRDTALGIEFILGLRPVDGRWDLRDDYRVTDANGNTTEYPKDGSKKRSRYHHWFIAQEVKALCDKLGFDFGGYQDHRIGGGEDVQTLGYDEFIPPVVRSIQQCWERLERLEERLAKAGL